MEIRILMKIFEKMDEKSMNAEGTKCKRQKGVANHEKSNSAHFLSCSQFSGIRICLQACAKHIRIKQNETQSQKHGT